MKVLIVDDSKTVHFFIKGLLPDEFDFSDAFDGVQAVDILDKETFDIILLDWEMPNLNGFETLKAVRAKGIETPVIMVTSVNKMENIAASLEAGANEYIMKPFTKEILAEKLETVLGKKVA